MYELSVDRDGGNGLLYTKVKLFVWIVCLYYRVYCSLFSVSCWCFKAILFYCHYHSLLRCPECGRLPPGRKKNESFRQLIGRKLSVRKSLSFKSTSSKQSGRSRDSRDRQGGAGVGPGGGGEDYGGGRHGDPSSSRGWTNQVIQSWLDLNNYI